MKRYLFWYQDEDEACIGTFMAEDIQQASKNFVQWMRCNQILTNDYQVSEVTDLTFFVTPI